jgi:hypothetical protein
MIFAMRLSDREQLKVARDLVRSGDFSKPQIDSVLAEVRRVSDRLKTKTKRSLLEESDYLLSLCLLSEVGDYEERYEEAAEIIQAAAKEVRVLVGGTLMNNYEGLKLYCQRIWVLIHFANAQYRREERDDAAELLQLCQNSLDEKLPLHPDWESEDPRLSKDRVPSNPYNLRSRLAYSMALVNRQSGGLDEARKLYGRAMKLQYYRLAFKTQKGSGDKQVEEKCTQYFIAKCLFGLGNIALRSGDLNRADGSLAAARSLLQATNCRLHQNYASLLEAQALRSRARPGANLSGLLHRLGRLIDDLRDFPSYQLRARIESARTNLLGGYEDPLALGDALKQINEVFDQFDHRGGPRNWRVWLSHARIVKSRILIRQTAVRPFNDAENVRTIAAARTLCSEVVSAKVAGTIETSLMVEGYIALAEVEMEHFRNSTARLDYGPAESSLAKAAELGDNPMTKGVCYLYLARIAARCGDTKNAVNRFLTWEQYHERRIENGFVLDLAEKVQSEVYRLQGAFILDAKDFPMKYGEICHRLHAWMLEGARKGLGDKFSKDAPDYLGISRSTFYNWQSETRGKKGGP